MFKAILTYFAARKIVSFIVCAAMMVGLLTVCLVAAAFAPQASADEMNPNPYAYKYFKMDDNPDGNALYVYEDGTVMFRSKDDLRVGQHYSSFVNENGELVVFDSNSSTIFKGVMDDGGILTDDDGNVWYPQY